MTIRKIGEREGHYTFGRVRPLLPEKTPKVSAEIDAALAKIAQQGERLCETPSYSALKTYREMTRELIGQYIARRYVESKKDEWMALGHTRFYQKLKQMDAIFYELNEDVRTGKVVRSRLEDRRMMLRQIVQDILC